MAKLEYSNQIRMSKSESRNRDGEEKAAWPVVPRSRFDILHSSFELDSRIRASPFEFPAGAFIGSFVILVRDGGSSI